jgi:hypothetical protein
MQRVEAIVSLPAPPRAESTVVIAVYPSSNVLPENQLKFYINFSAPMSRGDSYRHIRLLDAKGAPVEAPYLELAEELWDESGKRLTLLLDPGRVKRDLKPHVEIGGVLVEGRAYSLHIRADWRDATGNPLGGEFQKRFRVTKADTRQPEPARWQLTPPRARTRDPLVVIFDEPLDHALLQHVLRVADPEKHISEGDITIDWHETRWSFQPMKPWRAGNYQLIIEPALEDLAGNSIERPFEVYLPAGRPAQIDNKILAFKIK